MVNNVGVTEFDVQSQAEGWEYDQQASYPATKDESAAHLAVHDGHVMQWFADGDVAVIGHDGEEEKLHDTEKISEKYLNHAIVIRDGLVTSGYVV